jgi:hypothetical protein
MKIDDKVLEVCGKAIEVRMGYTEPRYKCSATIKELAESCLTAYLKETQPTAEVEPSCDVVEKVKMFCELGSSAYFGTEYARAMKDVVEYIKLNNTPALQQKPKAEVNELVGAINEAIKLQELAELITEWEGAKHLKLLASINAHPESKDVLEICEGMIKACELLTKCKNFIEGNYSKISNSSNGDEK